MPTEGCMQCGMQRLLLAACASIFDVLRLLCRSELCGAVFCSELCWGGVKHAVALLRMISPVNRGPQRATARRQYTGRCPPLEAEAPTQQVPKSTRQLYEAIRLAGSLHILLWKGSCSPGRFQLASCHLQHWLRVSSRGPEMACWNDLSLWG